MPSFTVFKGNESGVPKKSTTTKPDDLVADQVLVKITASGMCFTDMHHKHQDMVLGHEGVGVVEQVGPSVKGLAKGDRVGWGYSTGSCGRCLECLRGEDVFCPQRQMYGYANNDQGSFASHAVWPESILHPIPDELSDEAAAPLQCAGATVFTALQGVKPAETVAIMGVGGLGHLAIRFAAKLGCKVIVLSGSDSKKAEALRLGAHEFVAMGRGDSDKKPVSTRWPIDRLLVTTSAQPDWNAVLPLMAPRSTVYPLSVADGNLEVPYMSLIVSGIRIQGSLVATRAVHREMLQFAAVHDIKPITETFPMTEEGIQEAMDKLESGTIRFRAVLIPQEA